MQPVHDQSPDSSQPADAPELVFRRELVLAFGLFEITVSLFTCVTELTLGTPALGLLYLSVLPVIAGILIWLRAGGDPSRVGTALMALVFLVVTVINLATGGRAFGVNIGLPTMALFAILISSRRAGIAWVALVLVEIVAMAFLRRSDFDVPLPTNPNWVATAIDRIPFFMSVASALIGWMVLRALDRYRASLQEARAEATMNASRFADFADVAADGFWETDADLRLSYVSPSFARAMGLAPEQMLGLTPEQAYQLRFPEATGVSAFMQPLRDHQSFDSQLLAAGDHAGQRHWLLCQGKPIFDATGGFAGYRGTVKDVTEQRQAEKALKNSEHRLRMITENVPALIAYFDSEERYRYCNSLVGKVLDVASDELLGRTMREVRGEEIYAGLAGHVAAALRGEAVTFEGEGMWDGAHYYFQTSYIPDIAADGRLVGFYAVTFDITKFKDAELELAALARRLQMITDHMPVLISYIDSKRSFRFNNAEYAVWLDRPLEQITGHRIDEVYDAETCALIEPYLDIAFTGRKVTYEIEKAGRHVRATYVPDIDSDGIVRGVYGLIHDITQLKRVESELRSLAQHDTLTGLANRRRCEERLAEAIARSARGGQPMAVMFLDLDHLKDINDRFGHQGGDLALQEFARRLERCVRDTDTVARLAGDEFVIILEALHAPAGVEIVATKLLAAMTAPFAIAGAACALSTSIGIAVRRDDEIDGEVLLKRADAALYAAKGAGRSDFRVAD